MNTKHCSAVNTRHFLTVYTNARHDSLLFTFDLNGKCIASHFPLALKFNDMTFTWLRARTHEQRASLTTVYVLLVAVCITYVFEIYF